MALDLTPEHLREAVHRADPVSKEGFYERLFTLAFGSLVYPFALEDPVVDVEGLGLGPQSHVLVIASGGCNVLNYLTANVAKVSAVDLNRAHVALTELKIEGAKHLPDYESFFQFFGNGRHPGNPALYDTYLKGALSDPSRTYWNGRGVLRRRRITMFARNYYAQGILGYFSWFINTFVRLYGVRLPDLARATTLSEQQQLFDSGIRRIGQKRFWQWLLNQPASLYGLGIPPAQIKALTEDGTKRLADMQLERSERLCCAFPAGENYFLWRAARLPYTADGSTPLPLYLQREHFNTIKANAGRASVTHESLTRYLERQPERALTAFVLLDAQDWMDDAQLNALWTQITRTAVPGARVIFRTAGVETILPGRVAPDILDRWDYLAERSNALYERERAAVYGGVHLYELRDAP